MSIIRYTLASVLLLAISLVGPTRADSDIPNYSWLEGSWEGDGFGGRSEEVWSAPSPDGKMMGVYRHHKGDGSLNFYEFLVLDEQGMHLKHFSPQLHAWEEKEEYLTFEKIRYAEDSLIFKGLEFHYLPPDSMRIHLKMRNAEGQVRTEVFNMKRKKGTSSR